MTTKGKGRNIKKLNMNETQLVPCTFKTPVHTKQRILDIAMKFDMTLSETTSYLVTLGLESDDYKKRCDKKMEDFIMKIANGNPKVLKQYLEILSNV